jgi:A/G-specific adenine glycosylase
MGQPVRAPYEISPEAVKRISWLRGRLLSWFVDRYPSWASLEQAPLKDLENALRPLGFWRRKALSIEGRGGLIPRTRTELERLPGIGPYTASACWPSCTGGRSRFSM